MNGGLDRYVTRLNRLGEKAVYVTAEFKDLSSPFDSRGQSAGFAGCSCAMF